MFVAHHEIALHSAGEYNIALSIIAKGDAAVGSNDLAVGGFFGFVVELLDFSNEG